MKEGGRTEHGVSEGGKGRIEGGKGSEGGWVVSREGGREEGRGEGGFWSRHGYAHKHACGCYC